MLDSFPDVDKKRSKRSPQHLGEHHNTLARARRLFPFLGRSPKPRASRDCRSALLSRIELAWALVSTAWNSSEIQLIRFGITVPSECRATLVFGEQGIWSDREPLVAFSLVA